MTELDWDDVTMNDNWLAGRFEGNRQRLWAMAYRMLGSASDAEDAVQEAWIRAAGAGADGVANLDGWFTTIVARVSLDMLRSRRSRREEPTGDDLAAEPSGNGRGGQDGGPEQEAVLADSVGLALLVVLDTLGPAERVAFVLHDMFGVPFGEIASITGRSVDSARQLASRARRRVQGSDEAAGDGPSRGSGPVSGERLARQRAVAEAFLAASRAGDLQGLLAVLDPDVELHADLAASRPGAPTELHGARAVAYGARAASLRSKQSVVMLVNGLPGIVWAPAGRAAFVLAFSYRGDLISGIEVMADPDRLDQLELAVLE